MNLRCSKCKEHKDETEYGNDSRQPQRNFRRYVCLECSKLERLARSEKDAAYRESRREVKRAGDREYYQKNKDKICQYQKDYRTNNADIVKEYQSNYRATNKEYFQEYNKEYYLINREKLKAAAKLWRKNNLTKAREAGKLYYFVNKDKISLYKKKYSILNAESLSVKRKEYYQKNRERIRHYHKLWYENNKTTEVYKQRRRAIDVRLRQKEYFIVKQRMRRRFSCWLDRHGTEKQHSVHDLVRMSVFEFVKYIENQFTDGMTWQNINIDHYVPLKYFNPLNNEDMQIAWHYKNLRPMFAKENREKAAKLPDNYMEVIEDIRNSIAD